MPRANHTPEPLCNMILVGGAHGPFAVWAAAVGLNQDCGDIEEQIRLLESAPPHTKSDPGYVFAAGWALGRYHAMLLQETHPADTPSHRQ